MDYIYGELNQRFLPSEYTGDTTSTVEVIVDNVSKKIYANAHLDDSSVASQVEDWVINNLNYTDTQAQESSFIYGIDEVAGKPANFRRRRLSDINPIEFPDLPQSKITNLVEDLSDKVDKETGKGLSSNDYSNEEKAKLAGIEAGANNYVLPIASSNTLGGVKIGERLSINPETGVLSATGASTWGEVGEKPFETIGSGLKVENTVLSTDLAAVASSGDYSDLLNTPVNVSDFINDADYATNTEVASAVANKTDNTILGTNGTSLIFNEADGGGVKFEHSDGTWSFVGVNDGGENGITGQIYTVKKNSSTNKYEGTRLNLTKNGFYYLPNTDSSAFTAADEIAIKGDLDNYLAKNNTTAYTPSANYNPATKKYVDDNAVTFKPFPAAFDVSGTTSEFLDSIEALHLSAGTAYLGQVHLDDMPDGIYVQAEVEVYIYPQNVAYCVMRSAEVSPYQWECNSYQFRGWEPIDKTAKDYADTNFLKKTNTTAYTPTANYHPATKKYVDDSIVTYDVATQSANGLMSSADKIKLDGIEAEADVNIIETVKVNNTALTPDVSKAINIEVPTAVSELSNDSGFITNLVSDLANYYLKSETYTKTEVNSLVEAIKQFSYIVADELPTASAATMYTIYLIPSANPAVQNARDEFITIRSASEPYTYSWEQIGSTEIDLSDYYTKSETNTLLADKVDILVTGTNGTAQIFNETDGGGALFTGSAYKGFAGVHDGSNPDGTFATMYIKTIAGSTLARIDLDSDGKAHYLKNGASAAANNEIATLADIPEQQQSDWSQTISSSTDFIKNKPFNTIGTGLITNNGALEVDREVLSDTFSFTPVGTAIGEVKLCQQGTLYWAEVTLLGITQNTTFNISGFNLTNVSIPAGKALLLAYDYKNETVEISISNFQGTITSEITVTAGTDAIMHLSTPCFSLSTAINNSSKVGEAKVGQATVK